MAFVKKEKLFSREWFYNYGLIVLGCLIMSVGFNFFISPHHIVPGGVYGIGIVVNFLTEGMFPAMGADNGGFPIGTLGFILNIPLTIIGIKVLGPRFGIKTVLGFVLCMIFMDYVGIPIMPLVEDVLLSCVFGGVLIGFGLGLIFKARATSGGSDIIAMILAKYTRVSVGQLLIIVDSIIVLFGLLAFRDWKIPLYSWIVIYITGKVIDATMQGVNYEKSLFIISDKYQEIRNKIIIDLNRGGTVLKAEGMYNGNDRKVLFTNVNRREMAVLQDYIKEVDPAAFVTVINAHEIIGNGFKPFHEAEV